MSDIIRELLEYREDLARLGPHLEPLAKSMDRQSLAAGAEVLLDWLDSRAFQNRPWKLRLDPRGKYPHTERLLAECSALVELFEIVNDQLAFRPEIAPETRTEIERYVRQNYHPMVER